MKSKILLLILSVFAIKTGAQTLQSVTDNGNTTTNSISINTGSEGLSLLGNSYLSFKNAGSLSRMGYIQHDGSNLVLSSDVGHVGFTNNVGIGTANPGAKLSFNNVNDGTEGAAGITWYNPNPLVYGIHRTAGPWNAPDYQQLRLSWDTGIVMDPGTLYGRSYVDIKGEGLRVTTGNVGIGTTDTKGYKLAVAGNMIAESVKVKLQGAWPDYVFAQSYQLPTLQETEKHIKEKGHLPGIPSAAEVKANGIDLGEMNAKLLQKIEELTLHLLNESKTNIESQKRLNAQDLKIKMLTERLSKIEASKPNSL